MKKNLIIYSLLLSSVISTIDCIDFEKQKNTVINALLMGALVSGFHYVYGKIETRKLENTLPDAPPHFQKWAREILAKNGLANADTIPIKIGMGPEGAVVGGSFFQFRPNIIIMIEGIFTEKIIYSELDKKKILSEIERVILHEKKHYDNGDFGKKCLSSGITAASTMLLMDWIKPEKSVYSTCVKGIIATASGLKIRNIPYIRYQEREADRYASMNISLEKLQVCQGLWQNESNQFEKDLLNNDHNAKDSFLKKRTKPFFARELNNINESMDKNINNPKTLTTLKNKKRLYIEIASFIQDSEHQSRQSHTELMKECIDIRKAQEDTSSSELKKDIEEENFIFRDFVAGI